MSLAAFSTLRQRVNYLIGDTSATTSAIVDSHINSAVADICNAYPFSWNRSSASGTIAGSTPEYSFNLASDYNPIWHVMDARIVNAGTGSDNIYQEVVLEDRNSYAPGTYKYWVDYDTANHVYRFNTRDASGTVKYYYYFIPSALSAVSDICPVPDPEAVCYLAASKNWVTDERNQSLGASYKQEASTRIQSMWQKDASFGPVPSEGSAVDYNPYLLQR